MILTSLDEENGLVRKDLSPDLDMRFSSKDLALSDKFCWGKHDYQSLKKLIQIIKKISINWFTKSGYVDKKI